MSSPHTWTKRKLETILQHERHNLTHNQRQYFEALLHENTKMVLGKETTTQTGVNSDEDSDGDFLYTDESLDDMNLYTPIAPLETRSVPLSKSDTKKIDLDKNDDNDIENEALTETKHFPVSVRLKDSVFYFDPRYDLKWVHLDSGTFADVFKAVPKEFTPMMTRRRQIWQTDHKEEKDQLKNAVLRVVNIGLTPKIRTLPRGSKDSTLLDDCIACAELTSLFSSRQICPQLFDQYYTVDNQVFVRTAKEIPQYFCQLSEKYEYSLRDFLNDPRYASMTMNKLLTCNSAIDVDLTSNIKLVTLEMVIFQLIKKIADLGYIYFDFKPHNMVIKSIKHPILKARIMQLRVIDVGGDFCNRLPTVSVQTRTWTMLHIVTAVFKNYYNCMVPFLNKQRRHLAVHPSTIEEFNKTIRSHPNFQRVAQAYGTEKAFRAPQKVSFAQRMSMMNKRTF